MHWFRGELAGCRAVRRRAVDCDWRAWRAPWQAVGGAQVWGWDSAPPSFRSRKLQTCSAVSGVTTRGSRATWIKPQRLIMSLWTNLSMSFNMWAGRSRLALSRGGGGKVALGNKSNCEASFANAEPPTMSDVKRMHEIWGWMLFSGGLTFVTFSLFFFHRLTSN